MATPLTQPCCPWLLQMRKFWQFGFWPWIVAKWHIPQQSWLNNTTHSKTVWRSEYTLPGTWLYNFQPLILTTSATVHTITDSQTDKSHTICAAVRLAKSATAIHKISTDYFITLKEIYFTFNVHQFSSIKLLSIHWIWAILWDVFFDQPTLIDASRHRRNNWVLRYFITNWKTTSEQ